MGGNRQGFCHVSVMPEEVVGALVTRPEGIYVDCTLGGGGHARRIAERLVAEGRIIGIDQDGEAIRAAEERLADAPCHVDIARDNFSHLDAVLQSLGVLEIDGILFDLGVSSHQLDTAQRGFSYLRDAPLDMRMDQRNRRTAYDVVNQYGERELSRIFWEYGEERWAKRIAAFIAEERQHAPIETTGQLADLIRRAVPKAVRRAAGGHPAMRVFQAIRIEVNDELGILGDAFRAAVRHLRPGGRIAIISFHSLEDRIAKRTMQELARGCICPPEVPVCICGHVPELRILGKPLRPSPQECATNPRASSAKLRIGEKLPSSEG